MSQTEKSENSSSTSALAREITQNATDSASISDSGFEIYLRNWADSTNPVLSNWGVHLYAEIFQTIDQMTKLPEDDPLSLEPVVAHKALNLLGFLKEQMKIDPPKIINQDGEALALTWVAGNLKRYLTIADDEVDLMHLSLNQPFRCEEVLSQEDQLPYKAIFERLSAQPKSRSTESEQ